MTGREDVTPATVASSSVLMRGGRSTRWIIPTAIAVAAVAFVVLTALRGLPLNPYDESMYLDYLDRSMTQGSVRAGDELARAELECRGVIDYGTYGDGCGGSTDDDALFPYSGGTGADIYSPAHFWLTKIVAQPLTWLGIGLLDAGRLAGGAWAVLTTLAIVAALRVLRLHWSLVAGIPLLLIPPIAYWSFGSISTDAAVLAASAALPLAGVAVLVVAAQLAWLVVRSRAAVGGGAELDVGVGEFFAELLPAQAVMPFLQAGATGYTGTVASVSTTAVLAFFVPAAVLAAVFGLGRGSVPTERRLLGNPTLAVGLVTVPALTVATYLMRGAYITLPVRYRATFLPVFLMLVAHILDDARSPRVGWIVLGASALLAGAVWLV